MTHVRLLSVVVLLVLVSMFGPVQAQTPSSIDFDTFMRQGLDGRIRTFNQITPENRSELVQTLIKRWVEKNRSRLTAEQLKIMDDNLAFVTPDRYRAPLDEQQRRKLEELEKRTAAAFSPEDATETLTIYATHIPKN